MSDTEKGQYKGEHYQGVIYVDGFIRTNNGSRHSIHNPDNRREPEIAAENSIGETYKTTLKRDYPQLFFLLFTATPDELDELGFEAADVEGWESHVLLYETYPDVFTSVDDWDQKVGSVVRYWIQQQKTGE